MTKYKTGLVLSGGAVRGFAHLGVLKALEEFGMKPEIISGVSAGAIAGAFYADGFAPEEILEFYTHKNLFKLMEITFPKTGFFKAKGLEKTLKKNLRSKVFDDLKIPLVVAATNILEGKIEYFKEGQLVDAILASSCVPVLFEVVKINNIPYIDGGIMDNMPVKPIESLCEKLIGVYINPTGQINELKGIVHLAERAFHLAVASEMITKRSLFDIYIEPAEIINFGFFDIKKAPELFEVGYVKAKEILSRKVA